MTYKYNSTFITDSTFTPLYSEIYTELDNLNFKFTNNISKSNLIFHLNFNKFDELDEKVIDIIENDNFIVDTNIFLKYLSDNFKSNYIYEIFSKFDIPYMSSSKFEDLDFPFVLKERNSSQGKGIYLIENQEQISKLNSFYGGDFKDKFKSSKFIETKSEYYNHYRIFTLGSGEILGSVLNYSKNKKDDLEKIININSEFDNPDSIFFLNRKNITSNVSLGSISIPLNPTENSRNLTDLDKKILNNIGIENQELPNYLSEFACYTAQVFSKYGIYILGQDWIEDKNGDFYCLEVNYMPQTNIFNTLFNKGNYNLESGRKIGAKLIANGIKKDLDNRRLK